MKKPKKEPHQKGKVGRPEKYKTEEDCRKSKRVKDKMWRRNRRLVDRLKREVEASREDFEKKLEARYQLCNLIMGKSSNCSDSTDESRCVSKVAVREVVGCEKEVEVGGFATARGWKMEKNQMKEDSTMRRRTTTTTMYL